MNNSLSDIIIIFSLFLSINLVFCLFKFQDNDSCLYVYNTDLQIGIFISYVIFT